MSIYRKKEDMSKTSIAGFLFVWCRNRFGGDSILIFLVVIKALTAQLLNNKDKMHVVDV